MDRDVSREYLILHNEVRILHILKARYKEEDNDADMLRVRDALREGLILRNAVQILNISKSRFN